ncbi:MAG: PaaI family thioesterase [Pseudomonadota bacterium]
MQALGVEIEAWEAGFVRLAAPVAPWHANRGGLVHGGITSGLLDTAAGLAGTFTPPGEPARFAVTLSLTVNYLEPPKGGELVAEGRVMRAGRRVFFADANLLDRQGQRLANGSGVFRLMPAR